MKNLFVIDLGVELAFVALALAYPGFAIIFKGWLSVPLKWIAKVFVGKAVELGVLVIDLTYDAIRIAYESEKYAEQAHKLYKKTVKRKYTDAEKQIIRDQYVDHLHNLGKLHNG